MADFARLGGQKNKEEIKVETREGSMNEMMLKHAR
jgi:hypothetical protein